MTTTPSQSQLLLHILVLLASGGALLMMQQAAAIDDEHHELQLPITRPGCPDKCGDISIPFPFGMKPGCFLEGFQVTCNHSFQPPRAFLAYNRSAQTTVAVPYSTPSGKQSIIDYNHSSSDGALPIELIDISIAESAARAYAPVASVCSTNATSGFVRYAFTTLAFEMDGPKGPFLMSLVRNVLVGVGLVVHPLVSRFDHASEAPEEDYYLVSCRSQLMENLQLASNGSCSGRGCCQASLPEAPPFNGIFITMGPKANNSLWATNPCSFAMVVEDSWYNFSTTDLYGNTSNKFPRGVPYVIDFAIRNVKCPVKGQEPHSDYACVSGNSTCSDDVTNGYVCKCLEHYEGNPYIPNGCQGNNLPI
nr:unnamed protein product [Digitaria exilis]